MSNSSKKPSILLVANWDSNVGYAWWLMESYWAAIAAKYSNEYQVILAYPSISIVPEAINKASITVVENAFHEFSPQNVWQQLTFIRANNVKAIYYTDQRTRALRYLLFRLFGIKFICVHDHTPGLRDSSKGLKRVLKGWLNRLPFVTVDLAIGATDFIRDRLINVGCIPRHKTAAVNNGIYLTDVPASDIYSSFDMPKNKRIIVSTCRLNPYKNLDFALRVLALVQEEHHQSDWHYLILGDGPAREELEDLAKVLGVSNKVTFAGSVSDPMRYYQGCYLSFHPSKGEVGFSLSMLENMHCGLPVFASANPSVSGIVESGVNGFVYEEDNEASAAELLSDLLFTDGVSQEMRKSCMDYVKRRHNIADTHKKLTDLLEAKLV